MPAMLVQASIKDYPMVTNAETRRLFFFLGRGEEGLWSTNERYANAIV